MNEIFTLKKILRSLVFGTCLCGLTLAGYAQVPANDACSGAVSLIATTGTTCASPVSGSGLNATMSATIPACGTTPSNDVWYSFVATGTSQKISLNNIAPTNPVAVYFGYGLAVYSGACASLSEVDCATEFAFGSTPDVVMNIGGLTSGTTYYVQVFADEAYDDFFDPTAAGVSFDICVATPPPPPANDLPSGAVTINVDQPCSVPYSNESSFASVGEPGATCNGASEIYHTVWFKFAAPASGAVKITTNFSGYSLEDTRIALFAVGSPTDYTTFQSLACDEDNGTIGDGYASILYATGLTPSTEYYIVVDQYDDGISSGTFCMEVNTLTDAMLTATASCLNGQSIGSYSQYPGWRSLVDDDGNLIANVRKNVAATDIEYYSIDPMININQGPPRQDANGIVYLDRNSFFDGYAEDENGDEVTDPDMDLQLFFKQSELTAASATLSNLNVTHNPGTDCAGDFSGDGTQTVLTASGSGSSGNASWINITTPGFSNFYLMNGTVPLPIDLQSITAGNEGNRNKIDWTTAKEERGDYFELERSADSKNFAFLAKINAKGMASDYTYPDQAPVGGTNYYRLKMVHSDGEASYSKIVSAVVNGKGSFVLQASPNPVNTQLQVTVNGYSADATVTLSDITGKVIGSYKLTDNTMLIDMAGMGKGVYLVKYSDGTHTQTIKVSKQ